MIIQLTGICGNEVCVNFDNVTWFKLDLPERRTVIFFNSERTNLLVKETPTEIIEAIGFVERTLKDE